MCYGNSVRLSLILVSLVVKAVSNEAAIFLEKCELDAILVVDTLG